MPPSPDDDAVLLTDNQTSLMMGARPIDTTLLRDNTEALAKLAVIYGRPVVLTAALDWAPRSRHHATPFGYKPVGIVGASPAGGGTARGQMVLRQILLHAPACVMPEPRMLILFSLQKFDAKTGDLADEETRERLRRSLEAPVGWSGRVGRSARTPERSA